MPYVIRTSLRYGFVPKERFRALIGDYGLTTGTIAQKNMETGEQSLILRGHKKMVKNFAIVATLVITNYASAQAPDVKIKGDFSLGMTSSKDFSLGAKSYTPLGRYSHSLYKPRSRSGSKSFSLSVATLLPTTPTTIRSTNIMLRTLDSGGLASSTSHLEGAAFFVNPFSQPGLIRSFFLVDCLHRSPSSTEEKAVNTDWQGVSALEDLESVLR